MLFQALNGSKDMHGDTIAACSVCSHVVWCWKQAALDTAVQSDKAPALFDGAADKFQEVSAHGALTLCVLLVSSEFHRDIACSTRCRVAQSSRTRRAFVV